jgi:hypothetical protein
MIQKCYVFVNMIFLLLIICAINSNGKSLSSRLFYRLFYRLFLQVILQDNKVVVNPTFFYCIYNEKKLNFINN